MSAHPLAGAITKLRRSDEHLVSLYREVEAYVGNAPVELQPSRDAHGHGRFVVRVTRQPPLQIAAIVGDIVHNIRSALDYLAHEMIRVNGFPTGWMTQYPICATTKDFDNEAIGRGRLAGISLLGYRLIDGFQPHQMRSPFTHEHHPLWHLHKLSNLDKHRQLAFSALGTTARWRYIDRTTGDIRREDFLDRPMYDGEQVGSMPKIFIDEGMKIHARITSALAFRERPVADREVLAVLQSIREFVGEFIFPIITSQLFDPLPDDLILTSHGIPQAIRKGETWTGPRPSE